MDEILGLDDSDEEQLEIKENQSTLSEFVKLKSKGGEKEFTVEREIACFSSTIRTLLESPMAWNETSGPIPMMQFDEIEAETLEKVVEYLRYRKQHETSPANAEIPEFPIDIENVFPLMKAAHYLGL